MALLMWVKGLCVGELCLEGLWSPEFALAICQQAESLKGAPVSERGTSAGPFPTIDSTAFKEAARARPRSYTQTGALLCIAARPVHRHQPRAAPVRRARIFFISSSSALSPTCRFFLRLLSAAPLVPGHPPSVGRDSCCRQASQQGLPVAVLAAA